MVTFEAVTKRFGDTVVLHELDLIVPAGQFVSVIGPSGSGKTTILRLLMALERVDAGRIRVGGECLTHMQARSKEVPADERHLRRVRRRIGMVFQQFNLFPNMTVLDNITEGPIRALGLPRAEAEERAAQLLATVGMEGRADARPRELSGGQQQRVAIARALAMRPDLLLLDEITSALDPELIAGVLDVLREVARSSDITILCVTHEMGFARNVSDRILMLDQGRVIEDAVPEKLFSEPDHPRTREFLHAVLGRS